MPDGVDAVVAAGAAARRPRDARSPRRSGPSAEQLPARDDAVLPRRELRDPLLDGSCSRQRELFVEQRSPRRIARIASTADPESHQFSATPAAEHARRPPPPRRRRPRTNARQQRAARRHPTASVASHAAEPVLKPDHGAKRPHFIFTEEHERLRESIHAFVVKELAPARRGVGGDDVPRLGLPAHGRARVPRASIPEEYGGQGGDYSCNLVLAEELVHADCGGLAMGLAVHTDMATPPILAFGTEEQKQDYLAPAIRGEKISCLGITEPDAGSDVAGIRTRAMQDGDDYVINGSKTYITNGHRADFIVLVTKTDPDAGYDGFTLFLVDMDLPGVTREKRLEKLGMHASDTALLAFQDVRVPASAVARRGRQGLLPHHVGAPGRAAHRRGGLRRGRPARVRRDARLRQASAPRSAARSAASRSPATSSPRWRRRSRPRASSSTRPPGAS